MTGQLIEKPYVPVQSDGHKGPPGAIEGPSQGRKTSALPFMLHPPNSEALNDEKKSEL